ncbi:hypothetical protein CYY_002006 [Polysphondylium violaceum]|uniref:Uncharacterized protein n=1 Tax=Polysphondylium violaceum TaxID=133409 RepID=A0A8J4V3B1_9MYCE|nr:hypothetical protein CYY_002006 [Polysphondylium violaceum]
MEKESIMLDKSVEIDENDEYLGLLDQSKEELIELIKDIRFEYFELQETNDKLKATCDDKTKEIAYNRKLLTERDDLLLQLQWDPTQDATYLGQVNPNDHLHANDIKMKALIDQMRIMERGIFERDEKIKQMEKAIDMFELQRISHGIPTAPIQYAPYTTISSPNSAVNSPSSKNATPVLSRAFSTITDPSTPNVFKKISDYPLSHKFEEDEGISMSPKKHPLSHSGGNRAPSFWKSPSGYFANWRKGSGDQIRNNNDNGIDSQPIMKA